MKKIKKHIMRKIILILFALGCYLYLEAQNTPSISLHYHAYTFLHTGFEIGYENKLLGWEHTNKKDKQHWYQIYYGPSFGIYNYRGNHTGITLGSDLGLKTIGAKDFEFELFAGGHYLRAKNANTTFEQQSDGSFETVKGAGNNYFQWRAGLGIGKNFLPQGKPYSINLKLGVSQPEFPANLIIANIWIGGNYFF